MTGSASSNSYGTMYQNKEFLVSRCEGCDEPTIWHGDAMIYPLHSSVELPNADLPQDIQADYEVDSIYCQLLTSRCGCTTSPSCSKALPPSG
jgi:hypothetical protein